VVKGNPTNGFVSVLSNSTPNGNGAQIAFDLNNVGAAAVGMPSNTNALAFYVNGATTECMRIDSAGKFFIGTTSISAGYTSADVKVIVGGVNSPVIKYQSNTNHAWDTYNNGGTTFLFAYDASDKASINNSTGAYTALSDATKKKDFEPSTLGLDAVMALKPTLFRMIDDENSAEKQLGFLAQDVQTVIPQAYSESESPNGKFIGLQDRPIIAVLTKAIQELNAKVTALEAQLGAK
jgi:hypothetical protein